MTRGRPPRQPRPGILPAAAEERRDADGAAGDATAGCGSASDRSPADNGSALGSRLANDDGAFRSGLAGDGNRGRRAPGGGSDRTCIGAQRNDGRGNQNCSCKGQETHRRSLRFVESNCPRVSAAKLAKESGLRVNAGHGLNYDNVQALFAVPHLEELNIGHSIVSRAVFTGLTGAVKDMLALMEKYPG